VPGVELLEISDQFGGQIVARRTLGFGQAEPLDQRRFRLPDGEEQADQPPPFGVVPLVSRLGEQFHHPELRIASAHA